MFYKGLIEFGSIFKDDIELKLPTKPWSFKSSIIKGISVGNLYDYNTIKIKDSSVFKIKWHHFYENKDIYISDRVIAYNYEYNGDEKISIDGVNYTLTIIDDNLFKLITNELDIYRLPYYEEKAFDFFLKDSIHNRFWNWFGIYTLCKDNKIFGYDNIELIDNCCVDKNEIGFRPVLIKEDIKTRMTFSPYSINKSFMTKPMETDFMAISVFVKDIIEKPDYTSMKVYATANSKDSIIQWEEITNEYINGSWYYFDNIGYSVSIKYEFINLESLDDLTIKNIAIGVK